MTRFTENPAFRDINVTLLVHASLTHKCDHYFYPFLWFTGICEMPNIKLISKTLLLVFFTKQCVL